MKKIYLIILILISLFGLSGCTYQSETEISEENTELVTQNDENKQNESTESIEYESTGLSAEYSDNEIIEVDACNESGKRKSNVIVDIGYDSEQINREYYAYTNEYGQVTHVTADEIILQEDNEPMKGDGRYCADEAKVPGTESEQLDEGHIIADSLGGVSNAYNITPQNSYLNREGKQAEMEETMRTALEKGKSVTSFYAEITYPDTKTQIPSEYYYEFYINDEYYQYYFENK